LGGNFYKKLSDAYPETQNGDTIQARLASFKEDLVLDKDIAIKLKGGYDTSFANNPGVSTLEGILTVKWGTAVIEKFVIR